MDFSNPCPQVDFPGQTWYYSSKLGNWRFRVPVFCMALRAASLYPRTPARLLQVTASLQPLTRFCLLLVIARHVLAPAHTSFLLHVIANQCLAPADTRHVSAHLARRVLAPAHTSFLLHVIARRVLATAHTSFLLHVIARRILAPAHTSFLLHGIARHVLANADAFLSSACHCEPVRTLVWQSASPQ